MDFVPRMIICDGLQSAKSIILYFFPLPVEGSLKKAYGLSKVHLTSLYLLERERKITGSDFMLGSLNSFYDFLNFYWQSLRLCSISFARQMIVSSWGIFVSTLSSPYEYSKGLLVNSASTTFWVHIVVPILFKDKYYFSILTE
jgi:hypothetical protein